MATRWLSVRQAAEALGVSDKTIRRRVQRQMLDARTGAGNRMEVCVPVVGDDASVDLEPLAEPDPPAREAPAAPPPSPPPSPSPSPSAAFIAKAGRYSPLPGAARDDDATTPATATTATSAASDNADDAPAHDTSDAEGDNDRPGFRPGKLLGDGDADDTEDVARRFQRLAGASMMLAQRHADDAHEQLVHARGEIHRLRKLCQGAFVAAAALAIVGLFLIGVLGARASHANARLETQRERAQAAHVAMERADEQRWQVTERLLSLHAALAEHIDKLEPEQVEALSRLMNQWPEHAAESEAWRRQRGRR